MTHVVSALHNKYHNSSTSACTLEHQSAAAEPHDTNRHSSSNCLFSSYRLLSGVLFITWRQSRQQDVITSQTRLLLSVINTPSVDCGSYQHHCKCKCETYSLMFTTWNGLFNALYICIICIILFSYLINIFYSWIMWLLF